MEKNNSQPNNNNNSAQQTSIENFDPNIIAAFTYLIPPFTGIVFFLIEKKSNFVRFHALQSILFGVIAYILNTMVLNLRIIYIGLFLDPFVKLAIFGLWLFLMWKAYQNEEFELPFLGKIVKEQLEKYPLK